jgi:hypothetical protein
MNAAAGDERDVALGEGGDQRAGRVRRRRDRAPEGDHEGDLPVVTHAPRREVVVEQQRGLAGGRRALQRRRADADDRSALRERGQHTTQPLGAGDGVELVAPFRESRRGVEVVVGTECNHQDVGLIGAAVGGDASRHGIDLGDRFLQEAHAGLHEVAVREAHCVGRRPAEHQVELRVAEDERVALVDQGHSDVVAMRLRQHGGELEACETCSQDHDARLLHRATYTAAHGVFSQWNRVHAIPAMQEKEAALIVGPVSVGAQSARPLVAYTTYRRLRMSTIAGEMSVW